MINQRAIAALIDEMHAGDFDRQRAILDNIIANGAALYTRERMLPRFLPGFDYGDFSDAEIIAEIQQAIDEELKHFNSYKFNQNRLIGLRQALRAEKAMFGKKEQS